MEKTQPAYISIIDYFADVEDPRAGRAKKHEPGDIQTFGNAKIDWFKGFLKRFQDLFISWTKEVCELSRGEVVAIDGKTDDRSNETAAVPKLMKPLELKGCVAAIDAMGCQKKIAEEIASQGADCANDRGEWAKMASAAMMESARCADGETAVHRRCFISSLPARADKILKSVRERRTSFAGRVVRGRRRHDAVGQFGGEHAVSPPPGAESGEDGEVAEDRGGGEKKAGGLGFGLPARHILQLQE